MSPFPHHEQASDPEVNVRAFTAKMRVPSFLVMEGPPSRGPAPGPGPSPGFGIPGDIQALVGVVERSQAGSCYNAVAMTVFLYDYFLTIPSEVKYLWKAKFGLGSFLYLLLRVSAVIDATFSGIALSVVNILTFFLQPAISRFLLQQILHCIFSGRMLLNLREIAEREKTLGVVLTDHWGTPMSFAQPFADSSPINLTTSSEAGIRAEDSLGNPISG
ncbi:hypothetical protein M422DRAFT_245680 [Sphaerobolus stellatus SS14]|nr:hypothetical protein M422DRAFT_245680 [Sphaerobolus stellatus SS14]